MTPTTRPTAHLAAYCAHLRRAIDSRRAESVVMVCKHPVREGKDCVGPFLEDLTTACGLWEAELVSEAVRP